MIYCCCFFFVKSRNNIFGGNDKLGNVCYGGNEFY